MEESNEQKRDIEQDEVIPLNKDESSQRKRPSIKKIAIISLSCVAGLAVLSVGSYYGYGEYKTLKASSLAKTGDSDYAADKIAQAVTDYSTSLKYSPNSVVSIKLQHAKQMQGWESESKSSNYTALKSLHDSLVAADPKLYPSAKTLDNSVRNNLAKLLLDKAQTDIKYDELDDADSTLSEVGTLNPADTTLFNTLKKSLGDKYLADASSSYGKDDLAIAYNQATKASSYESGDAVSSLLNKIKSKQDAEAAAKKEAEEAALIPPLSIVQTYMGHNSIGDPEATVVVKNVSSKAVDAYKVAITPYDSFGKDVEFGGGSYNGIAQNFVLQPNQTYGGSQYWTLYNDETAVRYSARITEVHYTDGTTWSADTTTDSSDY